MPVVGSAATVMPVTGSYAIPVVGSDVHAMLSYLLLSRSCAHEASTVPCHHFSVSLSLSHCEPTCRVMMRNGHHAVNERICSNVERTCSHDTRFSPARRKRPGV